MGNFSKVWYGTVQKVEGAVANERRRVQKENKEGAGQTDGVKKKEKIAIAKGVVRVLQAAVGTSQAVWSTRKVEARVISTQDRIGEENEGQAGQRRKQKKENLS